VSQANKRRSLRLVAALGAVLAVAAGGIAWRLAAAPGAGRSVAPQSWEDRVLAWYLERRPELLAPPGGATAPVAFEVLPGESVAAVAGRLAAAGLVRDAGAFAQLARVTGKDTGVQAGRYSLRADMSAGEVLEALQTGLERGVVVSIPEGWRLEETAALLERQGIVAAADFVAAATDPGAARGGGVAAGRPEGSSLEGYLFPDTYELPADAAPADIVGRLAANLDARVPADFAARLAASGLSAHEAMTLASIVEREAVVPEERGPIARVFLNRLAAAPYLLDADPTVQYALGYQADLRSWWKRPLTSDDLALDSAFNTYRVPGLPPGPIASPGLAALMATLSAPEGAWAYFVLDGDACDGRHRFAVTYEEHLRNVAAYRASSCPQ
jgi:UPF0755 protein